MLRVLFMAIFSIAGFLLGREAYLHLISLHVANRAWLIGLTIGVPTLALAGTIGPGAEAVLDEGIIAYFSICPGPITLDDALTHAGTFLEAAASQAVRAFLAGRCN